MAEVKNKKLRALFEKTYEELSDAIFRYCYFHTSNREKALDITQETFIKTWEYMDSSHEIDNIKAFLYRVAKNLIIDDRRKKKSDSLDKMTEEGFEPRSEESELKIIENIFEAKMALRTVDKLSEKYKEVIILRFVEDMSVKDIAKVLRKNENTISVRIHRGIERLKIILEEQEK